MADKKQTKKLNINWKSVKLVAKVSMFWLLLAGVILLVQATDKNAYSRGVNDGLHQAQSILSK